MAMAKQQSITIGEAYNKVMEKVLTSVSSENSESTIFEDGNQKLEKNRIISFKLSDQRVKKSNTNSLTYKCQFVLLVKNDMMIIYS